jgi:hypothetical protein
MILHFSFIRQANYFSSANILDITIQLITFTTNYI